jgi:hypothetical protein
MLTQQPERVPRLQELMKLLQTNLYSSINPNPGILLIQQVGSISGLPQSLFQPVDGQPFLHHHYLVQALYY